MSQDPSISPILRYRDAAAAIDWLERAFGLRRIQVHEGDGGTIAHAELSYGNGVVMVSSDDPSRFREHAGQEWLYVVVDEDIDGHYERSKAAGAEIVMEPADQDYGSRDYSCRDLEGNLWSFGTYRPSLSGG